MRLTEIIQVNHSQELSKLCHLAKNLYNLANWYLRQDFFNLNNILTYYDLDFILKSKQPYQSLPSQTSQQILKYVTRNWKSYFRALVEYRKDPKKFRKNPKIPKYKKKNGETVTLFTNQQCKIKNGYLYFPKRADINPIKTSKGILLNADVNGAYNIMKKAFPNAISADGIEAFGLMPQIIQQNIVDIII